MWLSVRRNLRVCAAELIVLRCAVISQKRRRGYFLTKELACYVSYLPLQIVSFQIPQAGGIYFHRLLWSKIGIPAKDEKNPTSLGVTIAYPVWAPISLLMPFFSSVINVSHRRTLQVKKKSLAKDVRTIQICL